MTVKEELIHGFEKISSESLPEAAATVSIYRHVKSGARLLHFACDDDNKVFCAAFRTPSENSCGTAHIIEHSVLEGSAKYPLKDPFVHLMKGSLNTFLNAMTFPDKTIYPVASKNDTDFKNLMSVYLDAVFDPLIKSRKSTFLQEGWHYQLDSADSPLTVNGIVYNEMKGAFSDPEEVLARYSQAALFPDTSYAYESGGDPEYIPQLSYEDFLAFYKKYYHPANCYLFLYGDMQPREYMRFMDEEYLSRYDAAEINSLPCLQPEFAAPVEKTVKYQCDGDTDGRYYYALNYFIGDSGDVLLMHAFNVLVKILFDADASPLKAALFAEGIADETDCDYHTGLRQPFFSVTAKNASAANGTLFRQTVNSVLQGLVNDGIDRDIITAAVNNYEFELREADSGNYPKGLIYIIDIMESWLYDGDPLAFLKYEKYIELLHENENSAFYTSLIEKYILKNKNAAFLTLVPNNGCAAEQEEKKERLLNEYKASLSASQLAELAAETKDLADEQNRPDTAEAVKTIPVLELSEISPLPEKYELAISDTAGGRVLLYRDNCADIVYMDICFDLSQFAADELSAVELLTKILGVYKTKQHSEMALSNEIGKYLGDVDVSVGTYQNYGNWQAFEKRLIFSVKCLDKNIAKMVELSAEILADTVIDDIGRLKQTVTEEISKFEASMISSCESFVNGRIAGNTTPRGSFAEELKGLGYYRYLVRSAENTAAGGSTLADSLNAVYERLLTCIKTDVLFICDEKNLEVCMQTGKDFLKTLPARPAISTPSPFISGVSGEGIIIPAGVCYTGIGANFKAMGLDFPSVLPVVKKYLRTGYLWDNIRVKGGAYGALMNADAGGDIYFISYRDPFVGRTYEVYGGMQTDLENISLSADAMRKLIIGTISDADQPLPVYSRGRRALGDIYRSYTFEQQAAVRESILRATDADIRKTAALIGAVTERGVKVAAGYKAEIEKSSQLFNSIYTVSRS